MIKEQLNFIVSCLEFEGKITPFEEMLVLRDFNEFEVETLKSIENFETSEERARFLHFVYVMLIKPNITRLSAIQGSTEPMREYYSFALQRYQDARDIIFSVIGTLQKTPELLLRYFPGNLQVAQFNKVLDLCFLLDEKGKLKGRKTKELKEVFWAARDSGVTKESYFDLPKTDQMNIIRNISSAYGGKNVGKRSLIDAFNARDLKTYELALKEFSNFPPH